MRLVAAAFVALLLSADVPFAQSGVDLAGRWTGSWQHEFGSGSVELFVAQWGDRVAGTVQVTGSQGMFGHAQRPITGAVSGGTVSFTSHGSQCAIEARLTFTRGRRSDRLAGPFSCYASGSMTLERERKTPRPAAGAPATPAPSVPAPAPAADLTITITAPEDASRIDENPLYVVGVVSGGAPVARVVVMRDDLAVFEYRPDQPTERGLTLSVAVELQPGPNVIRVTAADAAGVQRAVERRVELRQRR